jgi:hypothetical protein
MVQKFIVNGVSYDSPVDMPQEVREQYERAMKVLKSVKQEGAEPGPWPGQDLNVMNVRVDIQRRGAPGAALLWVLLGAAVLIVLVSLLF